MRVKQTEVDLDPRAIEPAGRPDQAGPDRLPPPEAFGVPVRSPRPAAQPQRRK